MKALLIAEKTSLKEEIRSVYRKHKDKLDYDLDFIELSGHLLKLKLPDEINSAYKKWDYGNLPLDIHFADGDMSVYKIIPGKYDRLQSIRKKIKEGNYDFIVHAGDPDQEGEILVREVLQYLKCSLPVKRFWTNDLTEGTVLKVLQSLEPDRKYDNIAKAGFARQRLDYYYGMNLTEAMSVKSGDTVRMGRIKAAILRLLVAREKEIENFVPHSTYKRAFTYDAPTEETLTFVNEESFETKEAVTAGISIPTKAKVILSEVKKKSVKAPKLYKLSTLQKDAFYKFHLDGAQTLSVLQSLYEKKVTTYPRSDCEYLATGTNIEGIMNRCKAEIAIDPSIVAFRSGMQVRQDKAYCNDAAIATEGHTAIIPTGKVPEGLSKLEADIYEMIARRFLAVCTASKEVESIHLQAQDENEIVYDYRFTRDIRPEWEYILNPNYTKKELQFIPEKDTVLTPITFFEKEIEAKCPSRYNPGSLTDKLDKPDEFLDEESGRIKYIIGQPSSRANIIKDMLGDYFEQDKKGNYIPTQKAKIVVDDYGDLPIFEIVTSAKWEADLERVRIGEKDGIEVETELTGRLYAMIEAMRDRFVTKLRSVGTSFGASKDAKEELCLCPKCGKGKVLENKKAYFCSNWNASPKCDLTLWKGVGNGKAPLTRSEAKKLLEGKTITKTLISNKGTKWKQALYFDKNEGKVLFEKQSDLGIER